MSERDGERNQTKEKKVAVTGELRGNKTRTKELQQKKKKTGRQREREREREQFFLVPNVFL